MFGRLNMKEIINRQKKEITDLKFELELQKYKVDRQRTRELNEYLSSIDREFIGVVRNQQKYEDLLVIKLRNLDSVPEVYYKGDQPFDGRLLSVKYEWVNDDNEKNNNKQMIEIKGFDIEGKLINKHPSIDTIKRMRVNNY